MKKLFLFIAAATFCATANAEVITETFDANSFGWNECAFESSNGSAIIDKGVMTVKSKGENKAMGAFLTAMSGVKTQVGQNTFFETHCYAPINPAEDFKITTNVKIDKLSKDRVVGLVFNYRDGGNFYCFTFNDEMIQFKRYVDGGVVGSITTGMRWDKKSKAQQQWVLEKTGDELAFSVDGMEVLRVRYMPLEFSGVGFYTFGKQTLIVDDITFEQ